MPCPECPEIPEVGCLNPITTECVTYNGNDIDCANIASGQTLNQVIEQLANNDCDVQEQIEDIVQDIEELSGSVINLQINLEELSGNIQTQINDIPVFSCEDLSGCSLDNLSDVNISPVSGDNLIFNGIKWVTYQPEDYQFTCEELSGCTLDELSGVTITNAVSGDVVIHNGGQFINFPIQSLLSNLQNSINTLTSQLDIQNNAITLLSIRMDECSCPTGAALDVDFSDSTIDICYQDSAPGKLFGNVNLVGTGTDFDYFDGITLATVYISDAPSATTKTVGYFPTLNGSDPSYDIQLLSGMGNTIDTTVGLNTRTISFVVRFYDNASILHFATITANIPLLNNTDCSLDIPISYTLDDF